MKIKSLLPIIIALILIPAILSGIYLIRNTSSTQNIQTKADVEFKVSLSPVTISGITKDSDITLDLILNTAGKLISGVDVQLKYPDNISLTQFTADIAGSGLESAVIPGVPDNFSNTFRYVAVNKAGNLPVRSTIRLGQLKFKAVKDNTTSKVEITKATITIPGQEQVVNPTPDFGQYSIGTAPTPTPPTSTPTPTPTPPTPSCINGAVTGHRCVDSTDFVEWFKEWTHLSSDTKADFFPQCRIDGTRGDGIIDIADFEIWRRESTGVHRCQ